jgi:4-diphosphocytidyl-2-C-methyl-D-erythritol kinase
MIIETCAKVNLTLEVLRRRPDGYHELATVFQAIDLCDRLSFEPAPVLELVVEGCDLPTDHRNLCHRAATLLAGRAGIAPNVRITIDKRLPVGAGLGGGSGNAAGTLAALARFWRLAVGDDELEALAAELGSDCAFFVRGGAAVGLGRGEQLRRLPPPAGLSLVILGPAEPVPTGPVYGALRGFRPEAGAATRRLAEGLAAGCLPPASEWLVNDLEEPATRVSAALAADRALLESAVPGRYRLSGSGGSWFLPAVSAAEAEGLAARLRALWPGRAVWVTRPATDGWRLVSE